MIKRTRNLMLGDPILFGVMLALTVFGIAMVYSAGVLDVPSSNVAGVWRQQLLWFALAMLVTPLVLKVPVIWLEWAAQPIYYFCVILLVLTLVFGTGAGTAATVSGWLALGPVRIQPSEFAKIGVILMLARVLANWREAPATIWILWKPIIVVMVPMALVMAQPDLGTALVFTSILFGMLFWAGTPLSTLFFLVSPIVGLFFSINVWAWGIYFLLLVALLVLFYKPYLSEGAAILIANVIAGTVALPLWNKLEDYQKYRFTCFLDSSVDARSACYNLIQSQVAIGSGGWFGKGFLNGSQKRLQFLPEQHTDFIFAVIGEEWGFIGAATVLLAFGFIFWRLVRISEVSPDPFASLVPFGLFGSWFAHVVINTGMTVGVMPITGIPLPFLSYGGSFLLVNLLAMAIIQRIAAESRGRV